MGMRFRKKINYILEKIREVESAELSESEAINQEYVASDGFAEIHINIYDGFELFNPLSYGNQIDLSPDFYALVEEKLETIPTKYPIRLVFHGREFSRHECNVIRSTILEHYRYPLYEARGKLRINRVKALILFLIGILILGLYFTLSVVITEPIFMELLSILGSFFVWGAGDLWFIERRELQLEFLYAGQAAFAEVVFDNNKLNNYKRRHNSQQKWCENCD